MFNEPLLISVVINCYNGEKFLADAIDSVLEQTYTNWEIIIWDNQSTDSSSKIVKRYNDERIRYCLSRKHTSLYEARNAAVSVAVGSLIAFLDVDDWWHPDKLKIQVTKFNDVEVGVVCSKYWKYDQQSGRKRISSRRRLPSGWIADSLLRNYAIGFLTVVIRREALEELNLKFDPRFDIIGDFDLIILMALDWKIESVQLPLASYRIHDENLSKSSKKKQINEYYQWLKKMESVPSLSQLVSFDRIKQELIYMEARLLLQQGEISEAGKKFLSMKFTKYKVKLLLLIFKAQF